jgi:hypothetical protein
LDHLLLTLRFFHTLDGLAYLRPVLSIEGWSDLLGLFSFFRSGSLGLRFGLGLRSLLWWGLLGSDGCWTSHGKLNFRFFI